MTDLPTPHDALAYATDAGQRAVLFMDVMRQRSEQATRTMRKPCRTC